MTAKLPIKTPFIPNKPYSGKSSPARPSVPISVYREVIQELQTAQGRVDTLLSHNQKLVKQNKQLRREIGKIINFSHHLQENVGVTEEIIMPNVSTVTASPVVNHPEVEQTQVTELKAEPCPKLSSEKKPEGINGWILAISIGLIILTSGIGAFLIVSDRLNSPTK